MGPALYINVIASGGEVPHYARDKRRSEAIFPISNIYKYREDVLRLTMNQLARSSSQEVQFPANP
jgi:hypothetical protein